MERVWIDGMQGEGGGQMLRTGLAMSAVTGRPFRMVNIRAKRSTPGLKRQHLTCVKAMAEICGAEVSDVGVGSMELDFAPAAIRGGDYRFEIGTAGSVTLVAQTVLPVLLRADRVSTVTITGGTHVPMSPCWEFFADCYLPALKRMGARVEAKLGRAGFYPAAGGVATLRIWPLDRGSVPAEAFCLDDLGDFAGGRVVATVSGLKRDIADAEARIVAAQLADLGLVREVREVETNGPGNCCLVRLDYDRATVVFSSIGTYGRSRKAVANDVVGQVKAFLHAGRACEQHLADQLLVPLAVIRGARPRDVPLDIQRETLHYRTNVEVVEAFI